MARPFTYNYVQAKRMFIEGLGEDQAWPSLLALSEMCDIPYERLRNRCWQEHWIAERDEFQRRIEEERRARHFAELVEQRTRIDRAAIEAATDGLALLNIRLTEITAAALRDNRPASPRPRELETIATAAVRYHNLAERALGISPTQRIELTGADGAPVELATTLDVKGELRADDPDRLAAFVDAATRSGVIEAALVAVGPGEGLDAVTGPADGTDRHDGP